MYANRRVVLENCVQNFEEVIVYEACMHMYGELSPQEVEILLLCGTNGAHIFAAMYASCCLSPNIPEDCDVILVYAVCESSILSVLMQFRAVGVAFAGVGRTYIPAFPPVAEAYWWRFRPPPPGPSVLVLALHEHSTHVSVSRGDLYVNTGVTACRQLRCLFSFRPKSCAIAFRQQRNLRVLRSRPVVLRSPRHAEPPGLICDQLPRGSYYASV